MDLESLKSMKRHELQQEAKRIGIKANQASSVLIDLIRKHYEVGKDDFFKDRPGKKWLRKMNNWILLLAKALARKSQTIRSLM